MERWANKVAIVTGASSGIGYTIAKELVNHGMKVAALARRIDKLQELEKELNKNGYIKGIQCDVTKEEDINAAIKWVVTNWGGINVLVNNAGTILPETLIGGTGENFAKVMNTNVLACSKFTREVLEVMKHHDESQCHIININSIYGHYLLTMQYMSAYVVSKHALKVLTDLTRNELALMKSKIRVTSISPGIVETDLSRPYLHLFQTYLQLEDITKWVIYTLAAPQHVNISELVIEPTGELIFPPVQTT